MMKQIPQGSVCSHIANAMSVCDWWCNELHIVCEGPVEYFIIAIVLLPKMYGAYLYICGHIDVLLSKLPIYAWVCELNHWKLRVVMMPTLSSLVTPQVVIMKICGANSDKVGIITFVDFENLWDHRWWQNWHHDWLSVSSDMILSLNNTTWPSLIRYYLKHTNHQWKIIYFGLIKELHIGLCKTPIFHSYRPAMAGMSIVRVWGKLTMWYVDCTLIQQTFLVCI